MIIILILIYVVNFIANGRNLWIIKNIKKSYTSWNQKLYLWCPHSYCISKMVREMKRNRCQEKGVSPLPSPPLWTLTRGRYHLGAAGAGPPLLSWQCSRFHSHTSSIALACLELYVRQCPQKTPYTDLRLWERQVSPWLLLLSVHNTHVLLSVGKTCGSQACVQVSNLATG